MEILVRVDSKYVIAADLFDSEAAIEARVAAIPMERHGALRKTLRYLYLSGSPTNLDRDNIAIALPHLSVAEQKVAKWLQTRTNGSLRSSYGKDALIAAKSARYRCEECGFADVRVLNLDHVDGRVAGTKIRCLCANCHHIKSCASDWSGKAKPQCETAQVTDD